MGDSRFISVGQDECPSVITNPDADPKPLTFLVHLLGNNDQKCDQILRIQHKVFFAHNIAQCPSEEVSPESTWDKGVVISRKAHRGIPGPVGCPDPQHSHDMQVLGQQGQQGTARFRTLPGEGWGPWAKCPPAVCLGTQNCCAWRDPRSYHQSPELNPTPRSAALPQRKPPAVGRGSLAPGSLCYPNGTQRSAHATTWATPGRDRPRRGLRFTLHTLQVQQPGDIHLK